MQITSIILSGGKSSRMGTDKALVEIDCKPLIDRTIEFCQQVSRSIVISSGSTEHEKLGYRIVRDEIPNCGPMGGIYSCLKKTKTTWNFVKSVDSPFVELDFVQYLISEIGEFDAVVPIHKKGKEPLIALYNKSCLVEVEKRMGIGSFKMHDLLSSVNTKWIDSAVWLKKYPKLFYNINRPSDLQDCG